MVNLRLSQQPWKQKRMSDQCADADTLTSLDKKKVLKNVMNENVILLKIEDIYALDGKHTCLHKTSNILFVQHHFHCLYTWWANDGDKCWTQFSIKGWRRS